MDTLRVFIRWLESIDGVDVDRDGALGRRERDTALVLARRAPVLGVGTGTPPFAPVDMVGTAVLPDDGVNLPALWQDGHALDEGVLGTWFDVGAFNVGRFVVVHRCWTSFQQPRSGAGTPGHFSGKEAPRGAGLSYLYFIRQR